MTTLPPSCAVVMKYGNFNFLKPSGSLQACNGTVYVYILDALISHIYFDMKIYMFRTVPLSIIRNLFTVQSAMVYVIQVCRQLSRRTRMELEFHPGPAGNM